MVNDPSYFDRAEVIREKGTDRSRFFRGLVDKYTWVDVGSSYLPSDLLAAFLCAQLEALEHVQNDRKRAWDFYFENLAAWAAEHSVRLPIVPSHCDQSYHMFYLLLPSADDRQLLMEHLKKRMIYSVFHYIPLHLSRMGREFGGKEGDCPITEDVSDRLLRLPFYNGFVEEQQMRVISALQEFKAWKTPTSQVQHATGA